jgi:hypothetical protein
MCLLHNTTARSVTAVTETKIYFKIVKGVSFGAFLLSWNMEAQVFWDMTPRRGG